MSADLRAEFEAWARGCSTISLQRDPDAKEDYLRSVTQAAYLAYQAAAHATARRCADIAAIYSASYIVKDIKSEFPEAFGEG